MVCPHCSEQLNEGERFCSSCARPVVAAVAHSWDTTEGIPAYRGGPADGSAPEHTQVLPQAQERAAATGAPTRTPYTGAGYRQPGYHPGGLGYQPAPQVHPAQPAPTGTSWGPIVAGLLGLILVGLIGMGAFLFARGSFGNSPNISSSAPANPSAGGSANSALPSGAKACGESANGYTAHIGNDRTTCPFAEAVRDAWAGASSAAMAKLDVRSPVTGKTYQMSCSGTARVTCTGGTGAVVYLVRD